MDARILLIVGVCFAFTAATRQAVGAPAAAADVPADERFTVRPKVALKARVFPLETVRLGDGPFKRAQDADQRYLMQTLDPDRMLSWLIKNAGLEPKAEPYGGWDAHGSGTAGHYLSALAQMSASTGDPAVRTRMDYVVHEMARAQQKRGTGGIFSFDSDRTRYFDALRAGHVPNWPVAGWYIEHKLFAGLRDAYVLTGNVEARDTLLRLCDWAIDVTANLTDAQWQRMLAAEHGAPHEELADAYAITGDTKYLDLAKKFRQSALVDPLVAGRTAVLNNTHANTALAKVVGYERVYEMTGNPDWHTAAVHFYDYVTTDQSWITGGNSQWEAFFPPADFAAKVPETCGPETCNTYNLLKLAVKLFEIDPDARIADFYELALYNSILPSIDPQEGGFVYYTSMRPGHYRIFSTPYDSFWCCVGTGIENYARLGQMIYAKEGDDLLINLFIASELNWPKKGLKAKLETAFPESSNAKLTLQLKRPGEFAVKVRYPSWVEAGKLVVAVNGQRQDLGSAKPGSYVELRRTWRDGDQVELTLPMRVIAQPLPAVADRRNDYMAFRYGPVVLAAALGNRGLKPDDYTHGDRVRVQLADKKLPDEQVPMLVAPAGVDLAGRVKPVAGKNLAFTTGDLVRPVPVTLVPFYEIRRQRYAIYFRSLDREGYAAERERLEAAAKAAQTLDKRTVDQVRVGEQQPEADHHMNGDGTHSGETGGAYTHWRDATGWFSYEMAVDPPQQKQALRVVYWGGDDGRDFDILVNGTRVGSERLRADRPGENVIVTYPIPEALLRAKDAKPAARVTVRFEARPGSTAGGVFDVRIVRTD